METPHIDHLTSEDYEHIYEPAEDSFLLLDALEADLEYIESLKPCVCMEIGSGSGVIITALAKKLKNSICYATDINRHACLATKRTAERNSTVVNCLQGNLADCFRAHSIDLLLFNPPYVVTTDEELAMRSLSDSIQSKTSKNLVNSWAGGQFGRRIIDELLPELDTILSADGVLYLLLLRENKPEEIIEELAKFGYKAMKFMERRIPGEYLYILKVNKLR